MRDAAKHQKSPANMRLAMLLAAIAAAMYLFAWFKDWS